MTKKDVVCAVAEAQNIPQSMAKVLVQQTFDSIISVLLESGRIEIRNFGIFEVKRRAPRKARNPKTGEPVKVGERFAVSFKSGKEMAMQVHKAHSKKKKSTKKAAKK